MKKTAIEFTAIGEIGGIFARNKWPVEINEKYSLYNRVKNLYENYDPEEKKLFLKLLSEFRVINAGEYEQRLVAILERAHTQYCHRQQELYIMPIKQQHDQYKMKSADVVAYLCNCTQIRYSTQLHKVKFISISTSAYLKSKLNKFNSRKLFIVDDFIGTGRYAVDFIKELEEIGLPRECIVVLTLFGHKKGIKRLEQEHIEYLAGEVVDDGVLARLSSRELDILKKIEDALKIEDKYRFGYERSAALISLLRTPNNTLPMFYHGTYAPFPRKG